MVTAQMRAASDPGFDKANPHFLFLGKGEMSLFGLYGKVVGNTWAISENGSPDEMVFVRPFPFSSTLEFLLSAAHDRNPDTEVSYVLIHARIGLCLLLEGFVTPGHIRSGSWDGAAIEFNLNIIGRTYAINLVKNAGDGEIGAYDNEGVLI